MAALRDQWQAQRRQRQETMIERQQAVQASLAALQQQRQQQALQTRQQLQQFTNSRSQMAAQLHRDLRQFHDELQVLVSDLRLDLQQQLQVMQAGVAHTLAEHRQARRQEGEQTRAELSAYVGDLQIEVSTYLDALAQVRQAQAAELQQKLSQDRQTGIETVNAMFVELADFREELTAYRHTLAQAVWGDAQLIDEPALVVPSVASKVAPSPAKIVASSRPAAAPKVASGGAPSPTVIPSLEKPRVAKATKPSKSKSELIEEAIYQYLQANTGAKLTEIESTLEINRFQAVEALRSLIQKQLVVQRDRVYRINEEAVL
ncbi:MAG: hypothetical protein AAF215_12390 [Cyanobacteria bacterium P01_A01_bin.123]